jgi:hypothetical protein
VIGAPTSRGRRGWSLVDVAVAFVLLAFAFAGVTTFVLDLADTSETSVARAAARREISLAENLFSSDFSQLASCGPGASASSFIGFGIEASGGPQSVAAYVDVDLDGDADAVGWRVVDGELQRAVALNGGDCSAIDVSAASWERVLAPAQAPASGGFFTVVSDGFPAGFIGSCTGANSQDCRFQAVQLALVTRVGSESGPVRLDISQAVPESVGL